MKKFLTIITAVLTFGALNAVQAALDVYELADALVIMQPQNVSSGASITTKPVRVAQYKGQGMILLAVQGATNAAHFATVEIQTGSTTNGPWTNVVGAISTVTSNNAGGVRSVKIDMGATRGWLRAVASATNEADNIGAVLVTPKR